ncbi:hypothetical protein M2152_002087 [Microbacteriaceae bacterium SG_E_30_P1]|uniref:CopC domain-containing protein n=1 Tax=Antiquaquibacter oligotrophicus TaxID=2880260 RepID=A0ABT6KPI5_9MICO|nr:hypothetical protein [Antiquaquibacter oligotrophicus]MDH6181905.1 hypothetical protein [Antiquaquibacter oligotrophicus]UDF12422.1 hypothetical protein LH407_09650 [Antiquaquibacter oligotrophicus]
MTTKTRRGKSKAQPGAIALAVAALLAWGAATPALAHGGPFELEFGQDGAGGISLIAHYLEDGHPVTEIMDPVATAVASDGTAVGPVRLISSPEGEGLWISPEPFLTEGTWDVTVSTTTPGTASSTMTMDVDIVTDDAAPDASTATGIPTWLIWTLVAAGVLFVALLAALFVVRRRRSS